MEPLYRIERLTKRRDSGFSLDIPALTLDAGGPCTLVGPNGSGKSTLLGLLAFLDVPSSGTIRFDGRTVDWGAASLARLRRSVTLLHQSPYLFGGTVLDNVAFGLRVRGVRGQAMRRRVAEELKTVGLEGFEDRNARTLSGGEAQRVALARALATEPRVLLLDEPLANVDALTAAAVGEAIASLPRRGTTVVVTTHDPLLPARIGGETVRLADGRLFPAGSIPDNELSLPLPGVARHAHV